MPKKRPTQPDKECPEWTAAEFARAKTFHPWVDELFARELDALNVEVATLCAAIAQAGMVGWADRVAALTARRDELVTTALRRHTAGEP